MRKITSIAMSITALILLTGSALAGVKINETFDSGLPSSAPTVETAVALASGTWYINNVYGKTDGGSMRVAMKTNGYIITPSLSQPTSVTFNHRGSGSGKVLNVQKSVNGGAWVQIGSVSVSSASAYGSSTFSIGEGGSANVRLRFVCMSATIYIDNVKIDGADVVQEPTTQPSISAIGITGSSATINITPGNGTGRLLVYRKSADISWVPVDGASYTAGSAVDANHTIAYAGTASSITISGLMAGITYYFAAFEYSGSGASTNYLTTNPGKTQFTTPQVPTISVSVSSISYGSLLVGNTSRKEFTVSAQYLTPASGNILITGSSSFKISLQAASGFGTSLSLPYTSGTLATTTIYVEFSPTEYRTYNESLTVSGGGATARQISVSGTGTNSAVNVYYISPNGNDANTGTIDAPLKNLQVAVNKMVPGDIVYVRGGVYYPDFKQDGTKTTIRLTASGTADKRLSILNYPGEAPIINFRDQPKAVSIRGVQLNGNYWYIKGIHFTEAGDNGMKIEGNYNIIEKCTFSYNDDTGLQLGFGHVFSDTHPGISSNDGTYCAYNDIIDCDAYFNYDTDNRGSDADGFACKMHNGKGNRFIRCRAWDNSDDAWDLYETDYPVYLIECWAWGSGRASNFNVTGGSFQGNGNGIKLGGNGTGGSSKGKHEAWYCIAFNNNKTTSVKGFDQNSHGGGIKLVNCLAFGNGYDYMFETASGVREFYNNVAFGRLEIASGAIQGKNAAITNPSDGWTNNVASGFSTADYNSLTESDAKMPRGSDGSMPANFARLKVGSVLADKGDVISNSNSELAGLGLPWGYSGSAPDLGPYEGQTNSIAVSQVIINKNAIAQISAYPNPVKNRGNLKFSVSENSNVSIEIYSLNGTMVKKVLTQEVFPGVEYYYPLNVSGLPGGMYMVAMKTATGVHKCRIVVAQ
jgi:hypothetical protein